MRSSPSHAAAGNPWPSSPHTPLQGEAAALGSGASAGRPLSRICSQQSKLISKSLERPLVRSGFPRVKVQEAETAGASSEPGRSRARLVSAGRADTVRGGESTLTLQDA